MSLLLCRRNAGSKKIKKARDGQVYMVDKINKSYKPEFGDIIFRDVIDGD